MASLVNGRARTTGLVEEGVGDSVVKGREGRQQTRVFTSPSGNGWIPQTVVSNRGRLDQDDRLTG
jgi:hypothetical protein